MVGWTAEEAGVRRPSETIDAAEKIVGWSSGGRDGQWRKKSPCTVETKGRLSFSSALQGLESLLGCSPFGFKDRVRVTAGNRSWLRLRHVILHEIFGRAPRCV